jgi:hypothetical protein
MVMPIALWTSVKQRSPNFYNPRICQ